MKKILFVLLLICISLLYRCEAEDTSGACVMEWEGDPNEFDYWCYSGWDKSECTGLSSTTWVGGSSCSDLGYTKNCDGNYWEESWDSCKSSI